jgi:hypothetical protein
MSYHTGLDYKEKLTPSARVWFWGWNLNMSLTFGARVLKLPCDTPRRRNDHWSSFLFSQHYRPKYESYWSTRIGLATGLAEVQKSESAMLGTCLSFG